MSSRKLLRVDEVAARLDLSEPRVYALARQGILPSVRLGRQLRFSPEVLEEFIRSGGKALPGGWQREA